VPTFKITLAYDGTGYVGWQRQAAGTSVQGLVEEALTDLDGHPVAVAGAGRTDAGVHALGQVASFALERSLAPDALLRALNARLPEDVRVMSADAVAPEFHARFDATRKTYRYIICDGDVISPFDRRYAWHVPGGLDARAMDAAARLLEGRHDFSAFQRAGSRPPTAERTLTSSRVTRPPPVVTRGIPPLPEGDLIIYEVRGNGFLRHMVRAIAGTLVEIGRGRWAADRMREILASRDRTCAGRTAPPAGLFLVSVEYGDL
jgi:tRNA pseudouridine38-40 synthase